MKFCAFNKSHIPTIIIILGGPLKSAELPNVARVSKSLETLGLEGLLKITTNFGQDNTERAPPKCPA
jgi:hypothetical protein